MGAWFGRRAGLGNRRYGKHTSAGDSSLGGNVVKRKCETCRYYRDAGIACSGWCTHPERGDISDLVLVRRAELACRNSWDQDLWQPRPAGSKPLKLTPVEAHEPHIPRVEAEPPAVQPVAAAADNPTDRVTSFMVSRLEPQSELAGGMPPPVAGGQSARAASRPDVEGRDEPRDGAREGVSALEPGYNRALRVRSGAPATTPSGRMETRAIENADRKSVV